MTQGFLSAGPRFTYADPRKADPGPGGYDPSESLLLLSSVAAANLCVSTTMFPNCDQKEIVEATQASLWSDGVERVGAQKPHHTA